MKQILPVIIGLLALLAIGYLDLRTRRVTWEWLYIIILLCGFFTGGNLIVKTICTILGPLLLVLCAYFMAWIKNKKIGQQTMMQAALQYIGGADLKTIAVVTFWLGPDIMIFILPVCILFSTPFAVKPGMGLARKAKENMELETTSPAIPFCTAFALATLFVIGFSLGFSLEQKGAFF